MDVLLRLDLAETRQFFAAFFSLSEFHWRGFLSATLTFPQLIGFGLALFARSSNAARADLLVKGTKVDGIYSADPVLDPSAVRYARLTYDRVLDERLNVMDATAIVMCRDNGLPLKVFNLFNAGDLLRIARGEDVGTIVTN